MVCRYMQRFLFGSMKCRARPFKTVTLRLLHGQSSPEQSHEEEEEEEVLPSEWYENAFPKLQRLSHSLKGVDLIGGRLVNIHDNSRVFDEKLQLKMNAFKCVSRKFIGCTAVQETIKNNVMALLADQQLREFRYFSKPSEREMLAVRSLTKVADVLSVSAQQRKLVRHTICPQVTEHQIWTGALEEILSALRSEIDFLIHRGTASKGVRLAHQIVVSCLKCFDSVISYDPEATSWMRPVPTKGADSPDCQRWEDILEMSTDLINCLSEEKELSLHISKVEVMKEGLYHIRDVLIDKNIGYRETRHQENLVQKKLTKNLGHSSPCLFTLLLFYLYGSVRDMEVEVRGGMHAFGHGNKFCLYMGRILASSEEEMVWNGVKQLDKALGLFRFVWETAGMKGELGLQGHLFSVGTENRSLQYRGNTYFLHGINFLCN